MTSIQKATIYADEALLLRWGDSSTNGRTITLQLHESEEQHPFRGLPSGKNGQRVMIAVTLIGDDEQPAAPEDVKRDKSPADKAIAKAHVLAGTADFQRWLIPTMPHHDYRPDETEAVTMDKLRYRVGVKSTTEFRTDPEALKRFSDLCFEYEHRGMIR
jgi:hypothetical protein